MTTTAHLIKNADGSPFRIEIVHVDGFTRIEFRDHWANLRSFSGSLLELIREAEADSDPK